MGSIVAPSARRIALESADRAFNRIDQCRRELERRRAPKAILQALADADEALRTIVAVLTDEATSDDTRRGYRTGPRTHRRSRDFVEPLSRPEALLDSLVKVGREWIAVRDLTADDCRVVVRECRDRERVWQRAAYAFDSIRAAIERHRADEPVTVGDVLTEDQVKEMLGSSARRMLKPGGAAV